VADEAAVVEPGEVSRILEADKQARLKAIRAKADAGTVLSAAERQFLQDHATEETPPADGEAAMQPIWAKSQVELAQHLKCSRKTVNRYLEIEGDEAPPAPTPDGRYNVTLWKLWCQDHGHLKKKLTDAADRQALEDRTIALRNERMEMENAIKRGELISIDEASRVITEMVGGFVAGIRGMKHTLGPLVVGVPVPEATKRIGRESDNQLTKLSLGEWAKKKAFWSTISALLSDLHKRYNLGAGQSET
jgi:hypothetical protein